MVFAGDVLALVAHSSDNDGYTWFGSLGDQYSMGGTFYRYNYPITNPEWQPSFESSFDFSFRTYVIPVPEPGSALLSGIVGISVWAMRRAVAHGGRAYVTRHPSK